MSYERTTKDSVGYIANKFAENPGHFAATILRMYWDMEKERDQFKSERDSLIDDLAVLKANISRLERENERLKERNYQLAKTNDGLYLDNYKLEQENEKQLELLQDFSKFINYKLIVSPASDTYKHYRSELDKLGVK